MLWVRQSANVEYNINTIIVPKIFNINNILDINECDSSPCQNDAKCNDMVHQYNCTCAAGYTGDHCETGKILAVDEGIELQKEF